MVLLTFPRGITVSMYSRAQESEENFKNTLAKENKTLKGRKL